MDDRHSVSEQSSTVPICGIGASAGGLEALQKFFAALPNDLGLAYVVIVHLAPDRKSELPAILARWTSMPVIQVGDSDKALLVANHVYVIAPDRKLEITDTSVGSSPFVQVRGQRAAIDLFFRSLATSRGDGFAVVLSGSGSDGAFGARAVKESGGLVLVQDPNEASHGDMPRAVIATGVADLILPIDQMVARLAELARTKEKLTPVVRAVEKNDVVDGDQEKALKAIFDLLKTRTGHDFSKYKRATVLRRLGRRMQLCHQATIVDYLEYLRAHVTEIQGLFEDLLISVTSFFRDPGAWEALRHQVISFLIENTESGEQLRAWVPGCATGEEAYTLAILFHEEFERRGTQRDLIIFGSDPDESSLQIARAGLYPHAIGADVSESRLERYFRAEGDRYRVVNRIRDQIVFALHNLLRDPPFSRQHLISCRNLLIYLDHELQEKAMGVFRYACQDRAFLFLGLSEAADERLFRIIDKKYRIYAIRDLDQGDRPALPEIESMPGMPAFKQPGLARAAPHRMAAELHMSALEEVAPPSLLVNDVWDVVHLSSSASHFFQQIGGPPAHKVTDLVRPELRDELHAVLHRAFEDLEPHLSPFVSVSFGGNSRRVAMLVQRRPQSATEESQVLVTFLDGGEAANDAPAGERESSDAAVQSLREKLRQAEERFDSIRDDYYVTNEELRAANEELQSLNEEYRSTTEELETSKEELQSINEELQTVNSELKGKLEEISRSHSDLENLMAASEVATLFLDLDARISRYTPQAKEIFNIRRRDLGRPIGDLTHNLEYDSLEEDVRRVLAASSSIEREVTSRDGKVFVERLRPYRMAPDGQLGGVVLTFIELTEIKRVEAALRESEHKLEAELKVMRLLHRMSMAVATAAGMQDALDQILATAIELLDADFGNVQLLEAGSDQLRLVAHREFLAPFLNTFQLIGLEDQTACTRALRTRSTVCIEDVTLDPEYAPYRAAAAEAGYRAVQSQPLIGKGGELVGVLSIHFRNPHVFSQRDRQLGELVARQAADLIVSRTQQENITRLNEALSRRTTELEFSERQLSRKAAELLEQDRNKEGFLAALGHELRNPMAAIQNSLEVISGGDEMSQRAVVILRRQVQHMARLIDDLLDVSRTNLGTLRIQPAPVELNPLVQAALEAARSAAESKGLGLKIEIPADPIHVEADPERLSQILGNLLGNAVNYTDTGRITVSVRTTARHASISIKDTGIGVDPQHIAALFTPFQTAEPKRAGGLGLGLSLVRRLVELHGGTVEFASEGRGLGSTVTFTLPLARSAASAAIPADFVMPARRRILVVDDQHDVADMLAAVLQKMGQQVKVAYDGETALEIAFEQRPQIAIVDVAMPGMSGVELAQRLRQKFPSPAALTLVAFTGYAPDNAAFRPSDFDHHLLKPPTVERIAALLNSLLEKDPEQGK